MKKAIVVGSGIGGLATSIRLACQGFQVTVFEANAYPGGKLTAFSLGKYRFDAGPSLFTMPHFVSELFELAGENPTEHFAYKKKEIACQYFWEDGVQLTAYGDRNKLVNEIEKQLKVPSDTVLTYLENAQKKYERTQSLFLEQSLHKLSTYFSKDTLKGILHYRSFEIGKSLHEVNQKHLKEPHLVQMYDRYATYNGSSPFKTPGIMTLVQHLEQHYGTFIPYKGMEDISQSIYQLALRKGVRFHFNTTVSKIVIENKKAKGIQVKGEEFRSDVTIASADYHHVDQFLLEKQNRQYTPKYWDKRHLAPSSLIFYLGVNKKIPKLNHHNLFFDQDFDQHAKEIYDTKVWPKNPLYYASFPSITDSYFAPEGKEAATFLIPIAPGLEDNEAIRKKYFDIILDRLEKSTNQELRSSVLFVESFCVNDFIKDYNSYKGNAYGLANILTQTAFLRPKIKSKKVENLYFTGQLTVPGPGVPPSIISGKIVSEKIIKNI